MAYAFPQSGVDFLVELAANNSRDWFQANKKRYETDLKDPSRGLIGAVNEALMGIAPEYVTPPGKSVSRINRDIRFSKDKTPYNTHVWAKFLHQDAPPGTTAGFYLGFDADEKVGVGAGVWSPPKETMASLRDHFATKFSAYQEVITSPALKSFTIGASDAYKRVPKPYPADHPAAELLKLKGMHVKCDLDPKLLTSNKLVDTVAGHFQGLKPLVDFLNTGLAGGLTS